MRIAMYVAYADSQCTTYLTANWSLGADPNIGFLGCL